jgi:tetratricopeptide (TPR) repeat protein
VERERAQHASKNVSNWDKFQHAMWHFYKFTDEHTETARQHLTRMIQESPSYADTYALLAPIDCRRISFCESGEPQEELQEAFRHATQAVSLDDTNSLARVALSRVLMLQGKHHRAIDQAELSVALNPSSSVAHLCLAFALYWSGQAKEAMPIIDTSIRLSPKGPYRDVKLCGKALCFYALGKLDEAEVLAGRVVHGHLVGPVGLLTLAVIVSQLGRLKEANAIIAELLETWPNFRLSRLQACWHGLTPDYLNMFLRDLGSAGLPE